MTSQNRYARQIVLPEIGAAGQSKLKNARILCIGAGGLGCPALLYLAGAGIGTIGVVDGDQVDESNLQRQVLYTMYQLGENKAEAASNRLKAFNPDCAVVAYPFNLDNRNAEELFSDYDLIIDGTDNFETKFLINNAAVKYGKPFIYASVLGFQAQISLFNAGLNSPCYRCLFPEKPGGDIPNCTAAGVIGALVGQAGSIMALEAVKWITRHKEFKNLDGRVLNINGYDGAQIIINLPKDPDCPLCSKKPEDIIMPETFTAQEIEEIDPEQVKALQDFYLVDVREIEEWNAGHIEGAVNFPLSRILEGERPDLPQEKTIIFQCQKGVRSLHAAQMIVAEKPDLKVLNLAGGYEAWLSQ